MNEDPNNEFTFPASTSSSTCTTNIINRDHASLALLFLLSHLYTQTYTYIQPRSAKTSYNERFSYDDGCRTQEHFTWMPVHGLTRHIGSSFPTLPHLSCHHGTLYRRFYAVRTIVHPTHGHLISLAYHGHPDQYSSKTLFPHLAKQNLQGHCAIAELTLLGDWVAMKASFDVKKTGADLFFLESLESIHSVEEVYDLNGPLS